MLTQDQKQMYLDQLRQFQHALVEDEVVFIEVRRKADKKHVLIGCLQRDAALPPRAMGGKPEIVKQTVPIFEFVDLGDGTSPIDNPYEPPDPSYVEIRDPVIATGADVVREAAALAG